MATPTDWPKTGKDGRERGKEKAPRCDARGFLLAWRYWIIVGNFAI
jgi:hypothetical protein